mgnify:CR=1 FL=1
MSVYDELIGQAHIVQILQAAVTAAVAETGAAGPQDMRKVIELLKTRLAGRADMGKVSGLVKAALSK